MKQNQNIIESQNPYYFYQIKAHLQEYNIYVA